MWWFGIRAFLLRGFFFFDLGHGCIGIFSGSSGHGDYLVQWMVEEEEDDDREMVKWEWE